MNLLRKGLFRLMASKVCCQPVVRWHVLEAAHDKTKPSTSPARQPRGRGRGRNPNMSFRGMSHSDLRTSHKAPPFKCPTTFPSSTLLGPKPPTQRILGDVIQTVAHGAGRPLLYAVVRIQQLTMALGLNCQSSPICMALGRLCHFSVTHFLHLQNGDNSGTFLRGGL